MDSIPQKRCTGPCGRTLPATTEFFHRHKSVKDGLRSQCKTCRKAYNHRVDVQEYQRAYNKAYRDNHPELREQKRAYNSRPDVKERSHAYSKELYNKTREQRIAYQKAYRNRPGVREHRQAHTKTYLSRPEMQERNRNRARAYYHNPENYEHIRTRTKAYRDRPEVHARRIADARNRKARQKAIPGTHTAAQIQELLKRQRYRCYYAACGHAKFEKKDGQYIYHVDHTFPVSRASGDDPINDISYLVLACPVCNISKHDKYPWEFYQGGRLL